MGVYNATVVTTAGQNLIASAIAGGDSVNFTALKTSTHVYPAGTALQNLTALSDVKQSVAPTSVDVYNNNVVQISARVPNTGIATAYLINTIGLFGNAGGGAETLIAVLTAQTPDEVPVFDAESPAAFIFNVQMTIQNADTVVFEVNDSGTATVADVNRIAQPFTGATASAAGHAGRVPAPATGDNEKFLRGDATWTAPADMVEAFTSSDVADGSATAWTSVFPLTDGEQNKSIFAKISQMFKNIRFLYANGIKNITRNGTTFTATRINGSTFTFDQQDNNTTYNLASTSANGLLRALNGNTSNYLRGDGTWQTPPNTWRGIQNNLTSTSATESLSAAQGKLLREHINNYIYFSEQNLTISSGTIAAHSYAEYTKSYTPPSGYILSAVTTGIISGNAWLICSNAYYDYTNKKLHILANNTGNSAVTLSASAPIVAVWRMGLRREDF